MLNDLFHTFCWIVVLLLTLTMGNPVYLILNKGARQERIPTSPSPHLILPSHLSEVCLTLHSIFHVLFVLLL